MNRRRQFSVSREKERRGLCSCKQSLEKALDRQLASIDLLPPFATEDNLSESLARHSTAQMSFLCHSTERLTENQLQPFSAHHWNLVVGSAVLQAQKK